MKIFAVIIFLLILFNASISRAEKPIFTITIRDHLFYPVELTVPANKKFKLLIINKDPTPEEFESHKLNREKVVLGNSKTIIMLGPLQLGIYPFFGEFNLSTAHGRLIVK